MSAKDYTSDKRKLDANYNDVRMVQLGLLTKRSPDFEPDPESLSTCPLLTPSPTGGEYQTIDPLSAALEQKMLLDGKSPSPDFTQDEETALLATSPSVSYSHPLDPLRGLPYERQNTPSSVDTEMTGISCQPPCGPEVTDLEIGNPENISGCLGGGFQHEQRNSLPSEPLESSASSSSFALHDNASNATLLGNHYQQLDKRKKSDAAFMDQETCAKRVSLDLSGHKTTPDYGFLSWNWPLIRKSCFWTVVSALIACLCIVVAMLATVPRHCHPHHYWYQGTVFYEIFPASFQDSDRDGIGDLRGIASRVDYLYGLGVRAVRLNSIFPASHYPEHFEQITNLTDIEKSLGSFKDFRYFLSVVKEKNISVILDFPIYPFVKDLGELKVSVTRKNVADKITNVVHTHRSHRSAKEDPTLTKSEFDSQKMYLKPYIDGGIAGLMKSTSDHLNSILQSTVEEAIEFWFENGVDGIYLKGLENYVTDPKFLSELKKWKNIKDRFRISGEDKMLMCDYKVLSGITDEETALVVLSTMDLLDVFLDVSNGTSHIKSEVSKYQQSRIFDKRNYPWIHWNIGNVATKRLASKVENNLGAILFQFLLPGTVSVFYGDEMGLTEIHDPHLDHHDVKNVHQLAPMKWQPNGTGFTRPDILPWLPFAKTVRTNNIHEKIFSNMSYLRSDAPSIYMNSIWKEEESLSNFAFRYWDENIVVLERSYPRRNAYVVVFNAGDDEANNDLSNIYYGGELLEDSRGRNGLYVNFNNLKLGSGEACVVKLDK